MTVPFATQISNGQQERFSMEDLAVLPLAQYEQFVKDYPQRVLDFMSMSDQLADSQFSDSNFPAHIRVQILSLAIDLHLPMRLQLNVVPDMFNAAVLHLLMENAAERISSFIKEAEINSAVSNNVQPVTDVGSNEAQDSDTDGTMPISATL